LIVLIHLDPGLAAVDLFGYDAAFGEDEADFFERGVRREGGYVDGCVDAGFLGFRGGPVLECANLVSSAQVVYLLGGMDSSHFFTIDVLLLPLLRSGRRTLVDSLDSVGFALLFQ
jgi:hypothetical protein